MFNQKIKSKVLSIFAYFVFLAVSQAFTQITSDSLDQYGELQLEFKNIQNTHFYYVVNDDYNNYQKQPIYNPIQLPAGQSKITIITEDFDDYSFRVTIPNEKTIFKTISLQKSISPYHKYFYSSFSWIQSGINIIIYTDKDSDILIDGELIDRAKIKIDLPLGKHEITTIHELAGTTNRTIIITSKKLRRFEMFNKPVKITAQWVSLFPGASQIYKGEVIKGSTLLGLSLVSVGLAIKYHLSFIDNNDLYKEDKIFYNQSSRALSALANGDAAQKHYDAAKKDAEMRDIFIYTTLGIYALNIIDALLSDPIGGYREEYEIDLLKDLNVSVIQ